MSASNPDPPMPQQPRYKRNYGPESQEDFEAFYRREPTSYHRYIDRHEPRLEDYNDKKRFLCFPSRRSSYEWGTFLYISRSFLHLIFRLMTFMTMAISVTSTVLCYEYGITTDLPMSLISTAIFFPLSFGVNWTFNRRETILNTVADLKSVRMRHVQLVLMSQFNSYLMHHGVTVVDIHKSMDKMYKILEDLRQENDWIRSVISRAYQYHRYMLLDFERLRVIHDYRTPSSLRGYGLVWLGLMPALLGPFFAKYSHDYGFWSGVYTAIFVSILFSGLYGIQTDQEDPFDGVGVDDLNMQVLEEISLYMWDKAKPTTTGAPSQ